MDTAIAQISGFPPAIDTLSLAGKTLLGLSEAAALSAARIYGFTLAFPIFNWLGLSGVLQMGVAIGLAVPLMGPIYAEIGDPSVGLAGDLPSWLLVTLIAKEVVIGLMLGVLMALPFWAGEIAGAYADYYRGAALATLAAPRPDTQLLTTGAAIQLLMIALFVATGGLQGVLGVIYGSYEVWPALETAPPSMRPLAPFAAELLAEIFVLSLALAAPLLLVMGLVDLALGVASRLSPKLNVFDTSLSAKTLALLTLLPVYLYAFSQYYDGVTPRPEVIGARLLDAAERGAP